MFGYVRAFKPYMRVCEFDTYKAVYCGLCKTMGKQFGIASRFTLSYDFTFLSLLNLSINRVKMTGEPQRCIAHPFKKSPCATCTAGLKFPANAAIILTYHKLHDDLADKGFAKKALAFFSLPFFKKPYRKAKIKYKNLANNIEVQMKAQNRLEKNKTISIDKACEPTAKMLEAIASEISSDNDMKPKLARFGYHLGRFIYICDALDDAKDDYMKDSYNPLLYRCKHSKGVYDLSEKEFLKLCDFTDIAMNLTLGELAEAYVELEVEMYKPILDNIIYLGLKKVYGQIKHGKFDSKSKEK